MIVIIDGREFVPRDQLPVGSDEPPELTDADLPLQPCDCPPGCCAQFGGECYSFLLGPVVCRTPVAP